MKTLWRIGCCGFAKGRAAYFQRFSLVEVQQTFYKLPKENPAPAWRAAAPEQAEFVLKAPQLITHLPTSPTYRRLGMKIPLSKETAYGFFRATPEVRAARRRIETMAKELQSRLLLYQCPPSFKPTAENLKHLRTFFSRKRLMPAALELRGSQWEPHRISDVCMELDVIPVVDPLITKPLYGKDTAYFRLHGLPAFNYSYHYTSGDLERLFDRLAPVPVERCYVLFNNFSMFNSACDFQSFCTAKAN